MWLVNNFICAVACLFSFATALGRELRSELNMSNYSYIQEQNASTASPERTNSMNALTARVNYENEKDHSQRVSRAAVLYSVNERLPYFNIAELYYAKHASIATMTVGRRLNTWSSADEFWTLGFWQPRFNWDKVYPEFNGLTGVFITTHIVGGFTFVGLASPVFIPDFGPQYKIAHGKIYSEHPWFRGPPQKIALWGEETDVYAEVNAPSVREVVFNSVFAAQLLKDFGAGWSASISAARKPMNQYATSYGFKFRASEDDGGAVISVYPYFPHHRIYTGEVKRSGTSITNTVSVTRENPEYVQSMASRISQRFDPLTMYSYVCNYRISGSGPTEKNIYAGAMSVKGGIGPDYGDNAQPESQFEFRPRYLEAYRIGATWPVVAKRRILKNKFEITYDAKQTAYFFTNAVEFSPHRDWYAGVRADVIYVPGPAKSQYDNGFLRSYRANDRVGAQLGYIF